MAKESEIKVAKKTYCLNKKEEYFKALTVGDLDCFHCDISMKDCDFWKARSKDRELKWESWKDYLLG